MTLLKSIVACLVLANVGYFLWSRGIANTAQAPAQSSPAVLKLASESAGALRPASPGAGSAGGDRAAAGSSGMATDGGGTDTQRAEAGESARPQLLTNVKRCITVGPFRDVSEAAHAAATLRGGGYDPRQRVADGDVWAGVWVYLPLPPSRAAGDQILAKLKAGGVDDALEMPGPNDGSVISLGLFSEPKRAQARVAQAQALGFNPGIADRKRTGNVYWIDIDLKPTDSLLNPADLQGEAGHIVRLEVKGCPSIPGASP
ncbi:MAG TPA: hypothetical protein VNW26_06560 [Steroidobacteraceae bacterium]|nr:hypothetical protein [Steroidobacteraceae bacterium]